MLRLFSEQTLTLAETSGTCIGMATKRQKKMEYYLTKVGTPAPKRLIIESHEGGTHSITSTMSSPDSSDF